MSEEEELGFDFDILDCTKFVPEEVGRQCVSSRCRVKTLTVL